MKHYKLTGFIACALIMISCFLPWAYYPDLHTSFTGFYSEQGMYGKPGKVFIFFALCCLILILIDKVWAKRVSILFAALNIGYLIKTYVLFTSCYSTICPEKQYGLYLLILGCILLMVVSIFPDLKLEDEEEEKLSPNG